MTDRAGPDGPDVVTHRKETGPADVDPVLIERIGATGKVGEAHPLPDGRWLLGIGDAEPAACRGAGCSGRSRLDESFGAVP